MFPRRKSRDERFHQKYGKWITTWARDLLRKLDDKDEDGDRLIKILVHMVEFRVSRRMGCEEMSDAGFGHWLI